LFEEFLRVLDFYYIPRLHIMMATAEDSVFDSYEQCWKPNPRKPNKDHDSLKECWKRALSYEAFVNILTYTNVPSSIITNMKFEIRDLIDRIPREEKDSFDCVLTLLGVLESLESVKDLNNKYTDAEWCEWYNLTTEQRERKSGEQRERERVRERENERELERYREREREEKRKRE
jgi:hypothetical protein